jgi:hypothetical protein
VTAIPLIEGEAVIVPIVGLKADGVEEEEEEGEEEIEPVGTFRGEYAAADITERDPPSQFPPSSYYPALSKNPRSD